MTMETNANDVTKISRMLADMGMSVQNVSVAERLEFTSVDIKHAGMRVEWTMTTNEHTLSVLADNWAQQHREKLLREKNPALQSAWEQYQLLVALVQDGCE